MNIARQSDAHQLALALFEDFAPLSKSISEAPAEIGFSRNNILVEIEDLSLATRRALDAAYFIVSQEKAFCKTYEVDLNFFQWLMAYSSSNRKHFRSLIVEAQKAVIQVQDTDPDDEQDDRWGAVQMLGAVKIYKGKLVFEVHESLQRAIKNPVSSHFLSLRLIFSSLHAKILHDRLLSFVTEGNTPWIPIQELRRWLSCTTKTYDEFKYIKRDVLEPAIKQINSLSSISVSLDTRNLPGTKKIGEVRFRMKTEQHGTASMAPMMVLKELYDILNDEIGLSRAQFSEIISNREAWTDALIRQALEYTRFSLRRGKVNRSVSGFFMRALKDGYNVGSADLAILDGSANLGGVGFETAAEAGTVKNTLEEHLARQKASEARRVEDVTQRGMDLFLALDAQEQQQALQAFSLTSPAKVIATRTKTAVQALGTLVADNLWMRRALGSFMLERGEKASVKVRAARR